MATVPVPVEQRILLCDVSWDAYETFLKEFDGRAIRLTYDRGSLEIMTLSHGHENFAELLAHLVLVLAEELDLAIHSGGSTTFRSRPRKRGLEPDKCYWIQNEPAMRGKKEFDALIDPPPDLAIEVDISRSSLDRLAIYGALGIPELWRFDGETLRIYCLGSKERYREHEVSSVFPELQPAEVVGFLRASDMQDEISLVRSFRKWVRENLVSKRTVPRKSPRKK